MLLKDGCDKFNVSVNTSVNVSFTPSRLQPGITMGLQTARLVSVFFLVLGTAWATTSQGQSCLDLLSATQTKTQTASLQLELLRSFPPDFVYRQHDGLRNGPVTLTEGPPVISKKDGTRLERLFHKIMSSKTRSKPTDVTEEIDKVRESLEEATTGLRANSAEPSDGQVLMRIHIVYDKANGQFQFIPTLMTPKGEYAGTLNFSSEGLQTILIGLNKIFPEALRETLLHERSPDKKLGVDKYGNDVERQTHRSDLFKSLGIRKSVPGLGDVAQHGIFFEFAGYRQSLSATNPDHIGFHWDFHRAVLAPTKATGLQRTEIIDPFMFAGASPSHNAVERIDDIRHDYDRLNVPSPPSLYVVHTWPGYWEKNYGRTFQNQTRRNEEKSTVTIPPSRPNFAEIKSRPPKKEGPKSENRPAGGWVVRYQGWSDKTYDDVRLAREEMSKHGGKIRGVVVWDPYVVNPPEIKYDINGEPYEVY